MNFKPKTARNRGSIMAYILVAIFLAGLLVFTMTNGPQKSATTQQIDDLSDSMQSDIKALVAAISDCAQQYSTPVDRDGDGKTCSDATTGTCSGVSVIDNPNPPFPLYNNGITTSAYGSTWTPITSITCPGAPGLPVVFNKQRGQTLRTLDIYNTGTPTYSVYYRNDATEGVVIRITRATASTLWTEAISRLDARYSTCQAAQATDGATDSGACGSSTGHGCFYYWVVRRSTTAIVPTDNTVDCTNP